MFWLGHTIGLFVGDDKGIHSLFCCAATMNVFSFKQPNKTTKKSLVGSVNDNCFFVTALEAFAIGLSLCKQLAPIPSEKTLIFQTHRFCGVKILQNWFGVSTV